MATTSPSLPHPPPPKRHEGKRIFRSISRFLSGGSKTRSKLASHPTGANTPPARDTNGDVQLHEVRRSASRASTRASVLTGDDSLTGADTDASLRPISPSSAAPSSFVSRTSTASLAPTQRTFLSAVSTKPTTLLSIDSTAGANRIAVVPGTGLSSFPSGASIPASSPPQNSGITFSSLPPHLDSQVPRHTLAHPRNNPHPASPPPDNASMLTLASSSFAPSVSPSRLTNGAGSLLGARRIEADEDASVRALAPSRQASDESLGSRSTWSAAVRREKTASLRTVGTSGTEAWGGQGEGETEAQRVVSEAREEEEELGELGTPKKEEDARLPHVVPLPMPVFSTPTSPALDETSSTPPSAEIASNDSTPEPIVPPPTTTEEGITTPTKVNGMGTGIGTGLDTRSVASAAETEGSFQDAASRLGD